MLVARCQHCRRQITYTQGSNGLWYEDVSHVQLGSQYCWMDFQRGSQLHVPDFDTIEERDSH